MPEAPLRIAHVTTVSMSLRYMILSLLKSLSEAGCEVYGICSPGPEVEAVSAAGIRYLPVPMTRSFTPARDMHSLLELYRVMRRYRFTIIHTHTPKAGFLGQLAARMAGVPIIVNTVHGFYFHERTPFVKRRFYVALEKLAARCSTMVLSQSAEDMATAVNERICEPGKIQFLGNGVDATSFDPGRIRPETRDRKRQELGIPQSVPVIGFVGRIVAEKGIRELFQAFRIVQEALPEARLLMVGPADPEKNDALDFDAAHDYGIAEGCIFTGRREDMPDLYSLMDLVVLPSYREGFPRPPMEASFMGIPSVVTDVRGCREAVDHGVNGLIVPLGNVEALAAAILRLLKNPDERMRMGQAGRRIALERFDERRIAARVLQVYSQLLKSTGSTAPEGWVTDAV
ncbi:MAG TPA: glycosyltransferase family 4 protein [Acidobacteriota bacterium]|nr:glycosyltransferase family 4 protein [Acidobacteriota bacterium]